MITGIKKIAEQTAEAVADGPVFAEVQDALDLIGNCFYREMDRLILRQEQIAPDFFDLKTGIAGEVLQKFTSYNFRVAIVGDFSAVTSRSLRDFIRESNRTGQTVFVGSEAEALERLCVSAQGDLDTTKE